MDKSFRSFDTIDEAFSGFISILESNKYDLELKEYEKIILILKIPKFGKGEEIVNIEMKKNLFSFQNICQNLIQKINNLDKQMNDLVKEINIFFYFLLSILLIHLLLILSFYFLLLIY